MKHDTESAVAIYLDITNSGTSASEQSILSGSENSQKIIDSLLPTYRNYLDIITRRKLLPDEWVAFKVIAAIIAENFDIIKLRSSTNN